VPYDIDPTRELVAWTHTASEPAGVWTRTLEAILADPLFTSGFHILEDSRADHDLPNASDIRKGVNTIRRYQRALGRCRWAVVLRQESPAFYGMLRMAEMLLNETSVSLRPFTDMSEAVAWLSDAGARSIDPK
jgi:hypothetical protein